MNIPRQTGALGDHVKSLLHVLLSEPKSLKPELQMYHTLAPTLLPSVNFTIPFSGLLREGHSLLLPAKPEAV
jgi:hypothetical protein